MSNPVPNGAHQDVRAAGRLATVIIPAHNEAAVLSRCLRALALDPIGTDCQVVVVANGCTDQTAALARTFGPRLPYLDVIELDQPGKIRALNAGDSVATSFPRIYLDADVVLDQGALAGLIASLTTDAAAVASPRVRFDTKSSSWVVKAFYRVFAELPYVREGLIGLGVYAVSAAGWARVGTFPDVIADDLFVQRCFRSEERLISPGMFTVRVPRTAAALVQVRRRSAGGAQQLVGTMKDSDLVDSSSTSSTTMRSLARLVARRPRLAGASLVYLLVVLLSRFRPVRDARGWTRDDSSRIDSLPGPKIVDLDGLPLWSASASEVVDYVMQCLELGQGGIIATPNVDIMRHDARATRTVLDKVDVLVPDGMPLLWASRVQGEPLRERVPGSDLVWALSVAAAKHGRSVFLLGGAPGVADRAACAFRVLRPDLRVAGTASPPRGFEHSADEMTALRAQLRAAHPDLVFVALGNPRQEELAIALRNEMPHTWFLGCGGSFDMAAGDHHRAPEMVQRLGLEWLHRLRLEPGRLWRRYLVDDLPYAAGMLVRAGGRRIRRGVPSGWRV